MLRRAENHISSGGNTFTAWWCMCDCGSEPRIVLTNALTSGRSKSCGCQKDTIRKVCHDNFTTHGESKTRLYRVWVGMRKRCYDSNSSNYYLYGARGVKVCDEWARFELFRDWALAHGYNDSLSIDRVDVNGDYEPDNCRWSDRITQANNTRANVRYTINGETHTIAEWSRICGISQKMASKKLKSGKYTPEEIFKPN